MSLAALVVSCVLANGLVAQDRQDKDGAAQLPGDSGELVGKVVDIQKNSVTVLPKGMDTPVTFREPRMGGGVDRKALIKISKHMKRLRVGDFVHLKWIRKRDLFIARLDSISAERYSAYQPVVIADGPASNPVAESATTPTEPAKSSHKPPNSSPVAGDGLVAHWTGKLTADGKLRDEMGSHHGHIEGRTKYYDTAKRPCLGIETPGYAAIPHHADFERKATDSFTLAGWDWTNRKIKFQWHHLFTKRSTKTDGIWTGFDYKGTVKYRAGEKIAAGGRVERGWVHVALVQDGKAGTRTFYLNGKAQPDTSRAIDTTSSSPLYIGAMDAETVNAKNYIADVRWYNRALSAAEIIAIHGGGRAATIVAKPVEPARLSPKELIAQAGDNPSIQDMLTVIDMMLEAEKAGTSNTAPQSLPKPDRTQGGGDTNPHLAQIERSLLTKAVKAFQDRQGVSTWQSTSKSWQLVMVNSTNTKQVLEVPVAAQSFNVHPPSRGAIGIAWRSPMDGTVMINGRLTDAHEGGDSVAWKLHLLNGKGVIPLAVGAVAPRGNQMFSQVTRDRKPLRVPVRAGDFIQLTILPKRTYICDLTRVEWLLSEAGGRNRKWNITKDLVPDLLEDGKGNPHRDSYGNRNVWYFFDVTSDQILR
jgi:hypothetical protein